MADSEDRGVAAFRLTASVAQSRVRTLAVNSSNLKWSKHIQERMIERDIGAPQVLRILRTGYVDKPPIPGKYSGEWKIKITRTMANGRAAGVVTMLINDRTLHLLTVEWEDSV